MDWYTSFDVWRDRERIRRRRRGEPDRFWRLLLDGLVWILSPTGDMRKFGELPPPRGWKEVLADGIIHVVEMGVALIVLGWRVVLAALILVVLWLLLVP